jgi:putative transposase
MNLAHKIELKPNKEQRNMLVRAAGCARFTYNWALAEWERQYKNGEKPTAMKLKKQFNSIKQQEFPWIYESPKDANQQPFANLQKAFDRFFKKTSACPVFKKKYTNDSFYISNDQFKIDKKFIKLPLIGKIKLEEELRFEGKIMSATVSRQADRWFVSISVEMETYEKPRISNKTIALDFGIKTFAVDQNGTEYISPKPLKNKLQKLKRYQRIYSRRKDGSQNKKKQRTKVAKIHKEIKDLRHDFTHKFTTQICRENQTIVIEDLNLKNWSKMFGKSGIDGGVGEARRQIKYKSLIYNNNLVVIDKWTPTSKSCSSCGSYKNDLKLSDRLFRCADCGHEMDRDHNAARNIYASGHAQMRRIGMACPEFTPLDI